MHTKQQIQDEEYWFPYHYVSQYNPDFFQTFNDTWGINYVATIEFMLNKVSVEKFNSIIDIGCGDGRFIQELQSKYPDKYIMGIDYSPKAIMLAQALNPSGKFRCIDLTKTGIDYKFDIAILMEVLEHIPPENTGHFINSISKLLDVNGKLLVTVPHINKPVEDKHFRHFDKDTISECLAPSFKIIEIIPFEKISLRKKLIDMLLTNRIFILNHKATLNKIYNYFKSSLFVVPDERNCSRLFILAQRLPE